MNVYHPSGVLLAFRFCCLLVLILAGSSACSRSGINDGADRGDGMDLQAGQAVSPEKMAKPSTTQGEQSLFDAIQARDADWINQLVKEGVDLNSTNQDGLTPLMFAMDRSELGVCRFLIKHGADVNLKVAGIGTPLHLAARKSTSEYVDLLIENGAKPDSLDSTGMTPAMWAANDEFYFDSLKSLVKAGCDLDVRSSPGSRGLTALMYSTDSSLKVVQFLLESGADASIRNEDGLTASEEIRRSMRGAGREPVTEREKLLLEKIRLLRQYEAKSDQDE